MYVCMYVCMCVCVYSNMPSTNSQRMSKMPAHYIIIKIYTGFFSWGVYSNMLKLGGFGGLLPQENFEIYDI